jgi:hypothetical protein
MNPIVLHSLMILVELCPRPFTIFFVCHTHAIRDHVLVLVHILFSSRRAARATQEVKVIGSLEHLIYILNN